MKHLASAPLFAVLSSVVLAATLCSGAIAQTADGKDKQDTKPANEQVIVPEVARRDVKLPKFPSRDFEIGLFGGMYATQNFGTSPVAGIRFSYHLTEDFFVEAALGRTKVTDEAYSATLPSPILNSHEETLTYYNVSFGYNLFPGEIFIGRNWAKPSQLYLIGGVGSTKFNDQSNQTINVGWGFRVFPSNRWSLKLDMRDHIFNLDLLGKRDRTHNIEMTLGASFFF